MAFYLIAYTVIILVVALVVFIELVGHGVIFRTVGPIQRTFGHPLVRYSLRRIGSALISVLLAIIVTFFLIRASTDIDTLCKTTQFSSNYLKLPPAIVEARCAIFRQEMGFAGGPMQQLFQFLYNIFPFPKTLCSTKDTLIGATYYNTVTNCRFFLMDLGKIYSKAVAGPAAPVYVLDYIGEKMAVSFPIGALATVVEIALGYPLGILMAKHKDGIPDKIGKAYIISIDAIPGVAYYYIWMSIFVAGFMLPSKYDAGNFLSWLPPVLTIGFTGMAGIALWVRRYMIDELNSDYVKFARAKGLTEGRIARTHVLRNAVVPLVRTFPSAILGALLGSFYIEKIYQINGIGNMLIVANDANDFFAVQGIVIVSALISIVAYLAGDIVTAMADPRISLAGE